MQEKTIRVAMTLATAVVTAAISIFGTSKVYSNQIKNQIKNEVNNNIQVNGGSYDKPISELISMYNALNNENEKLKKENNQYKNSITQPANAPAPDESTAVPPIDKTVKLLEACTAFDVERYYCKVNYDVQVSGNEYSGAIFMDGFGGKNGVKFNLEKKYTKLFFNLGHVDESSTEGTFTLKINLDGIDLEPISITADDHIVTKSIDVQNVNYIHITWNISKGSGQYAILDAKLS